MGVTKVDEKFVNFASDPPHVWNIHSHVCGHRAFDIGANGGMTARLYAANFDEVHAFEPGSECYDHLTKDLPEHVWAHQIAVSDHNGKVTMEERADAFGRWGELTTGDTLTRVWGEVTGTRTVPCRTVDSLAEEYGDPDYIKIDTEGHERPILEGALETIDRCNPRLFVEIHNGEHGEWFMRECGGTLTQIRHPAYNPEGHLFHHHYWLLKGLNT